MYSYQNILIKDIIKRKKNPENSLQKDKSNGKMFEKAKNDAEKIRAFTVGFRTENSQVMVTVRHDYRPERETT